MSALQTAVPANTKALGCLGFSSLLILLVAPGWRTSLEHALSPNALARKVGCCLSCKQFNYFVQVLIHFQGIYSEQKGS